jgi:dephospho-CoA kinase
MDRLEHTPAPLLVLDAIRLIEGGLYQRCDTVWVVVCDRQLQQQRLEATRNLSAEQAALRIAAQRPQEEKLRYANAVLRNNASLDDLAAQIASAWATTVAPHLAPGPG